MGVALSLSQLSLSLRFLSPSLHLFSYCREDRSYNFSARFKGVVFSFLGFLLPLILFINFLASNASEGLLNSTLGAGNTDALKLYMVRSCETL